MYRFLLALFLFAAPAWAQTLPQLPDETEPVIGAAVPASPNAATNAGMPATFNPAASRPLVPLAPNGFAPPVSAASIAELAARLKALEARLSNGEAPADAQNAPLMRFKLEQAHLWLRAYELAVSPEASLATAPTTELTFTPNEAANGLTGAIERASAISRLKGDAPLGFKSQMHERAYVAPDGSVQPFWIFLPRDYNPKKSYPLVVFLHGYSPYLSKIEPWIPSEETWNLATSRGFIMAIPYGRRNSDFVNVGEDDTMTVTNEAKRLYSIDSERVFLMGASMGGFGVYAVGLHHPDVWAGLAPMAARSDYYLWFALNRDAIPAWKRLLYDADDPRQLETNALHLPIFMQHGALDNVVAVEHSRRLSADLKARGYAVRYREVPDADHYIYWQAEAYQTALNWMSYLTRVHDPRRVVYASGSLRENRAYWAEIGAFEDYSKPAHLDAEIKIGNVLEVSAQNVARFVLSPPVSRLEAGPITLRVNGQEAAQKFEAGKPIVWPLNEANPERERRADGDIKTPTRCGPVKNAFRDPFLLVYGTGTQDPNGESDEARARKFASEWSAFADGVPPIKADTEVTDDDKAKYNLILFGTRDSNSLIAPFADKLPVELTSNGYRLGQKKFEGRDLGLWECFASPFDAKRLVVVQSGRAWGAALPVNHKLDLIPDYIVYDSAFEPGTAAQRANAYDWSDQINHPIAAGFFDGNWQLPPNAAPEPAPQLMPIARAPIPVSP